MSGKKVVVYHAGCWDGFCAAWLFRYWLPEAEFIPAQYGDDPPDLTGVECAYVLDFSYPREALLAMSQDVGESVMVMDHHKTAQQDLADLDECDGAGRLIVDFDMDRSGGRMAWDFLCANGLLPDHLHTFVADTPNWLVTYTEDRDLWRWKLPGSKGVNAALRSYPLDFDLWDTLSRREPLDLAIEGDAILRYKQVLVDQHLQFARLAHFNFSRYSVPAVNCSAADLQSEVAGALSEEHDFGAVWVDRGDGTQLWSLRSRKGGVDVSEVAKSYGGGGHRAASGFRCERGTIRIGQRLKSCKGV